MRICLHLRLHAIQGKSEIADGVSRSPLHRFLYHENVRALECNQTLRSANDKLVILNDKEGQIKCNDCKGTNQSCDRILQKLKSAFEMTFISAATNIDLLEGLGC
jgi:hypothetical protein